ncbi:flagellar basal body-associated FliL family protein [Aliidiomarina soli]|uniref:Flagellar protein FliL n=1 Tax=Aliidiomarina soli TaxID=1928574 RepID=A0A432WEJ8_9GAMM|nr:flagellar basal body-associated FliL family protein [Aliidiomarina soli]RUO31286.1 flagellar basal body-associated protein FliL [Aliidiomarina soli]
MAEEQDQVQEQETKSKIGLIAGGVVVVLLILVLVWFFFLRGGDQPSVSEQVGPEQVAADDSESARYVPLPKDFIFNVAGDRRDRMAQISVQLMVRGSRNERLALENIPLIESTLLDVFSRASADRLNSPEGKRELRVQTLDAVREVLREATNGSPVVEEVLFTGMVLQ